MRPADDDGVDREVETFSERRTTGLKFKVHLKASDRAPTPGPFRRVTTDQVVCWKSLDVPVLIVYWVVEQGSDLSAHGDAHLDAVAQELNERPRQTLGWATPAEKLAELLAAADAPIT